MNTSYPCHTYIHMVILLLWHKFYFTRKVTGIYFALIQLNRLLQWEAQTCTTVIGFDEAPRIAKEVSSTSYSQESGFARIVKIFSWWFVWQAYVWRNFDATYLSDYNLNDQDRIINLIFRYQKFTVISLCYRLSKISACSLRQSTSASK